MTNKCALRAQHGQEDEDMKERTEGTKVCAVAMKRETNAQGQKVSHTSLSEPGRPKPKCTVAVRVQPKARTDVSQKKERGEMTGHERKEEKKKCVKGKKDEKGNQMKGTGTDENKPHSKDLGRLA